MKVVIRVSGKALPQGTLVRNPHGKGVFHVGGDRGPLQAWRSDIKRKAEDTMAEAGLEMIPAGHPVAIRIVFERARLQKHKRSDGTPRADAPKWVVGPPDIDKLERAVLDALSDVVFADDKQVVSLFAQQVYAETNAMLIVVTDDEWRFD